MNLNTPTIGRVVHYRTNGDPKPCAAIVVDDERGDGEIMLQVFSRNGVRFLEVLPREPGATTAKGSYWEWPPRV